MALTIPSRQRTINTGLETTPSNVSGGLVIPSRTTFKGSETAGATQAKELLGGMLETGQAQVSPGGLSLPSRKAPSVFDRLKSKVVNFLSDPTEVTPGQFFSTAIEKVQEARGFIKSKADFLLPTEEDIDPDTGISRFGEIPIRNAETGEIEGAIDVIGVTSLGIKSKRLVSKALNKIMDEGTPAVKRTARKLMGNLIGETEERAIKTIEDDLFAMAKKPTTLIKPKSLEVTKRAIDELFVPTAKAADAPIAREVAEEVTEVAPKLSDDIAKAKQAGKSFDEFVGSKEKVFHGTLEESVSNIEKEGFKTRIALGKTTSHADDAVFGDVTWLVNDKKQAQKFAEQMGTDRGVTTFQGANTAVLDTYLEDGIKIAKQPRANTTSEYRKLVDELKKTYDGIELPGGIKVIWNKDKIKTKSQLKQLWDKPVEPKVIPETRREVAEKLADRQELKELNEQFQKQAKIETLERQAGRGEVLTKELSDREVLSQRRRLVRAAKSQFGLSDTDARKISRRDIRLMDDAEFEQYINDFRARASELAKTTQAKNEVTARIMKQELEKTENLRKAMDLPPLNKMSVKQLKEFDEALSKAQFGDKFLSPRQLETVAKTDLGGIKTTREAREKLAKELGVKVEDLNNIKVGELDKFRWDTALAERNPFYKMMVENTHENLLVGEKNFLQLEDKINDLTKKARASRKRTLGEKAIPSDEKVFDFISGNKDLAKEMTPEELDLANFLQVKFSDALEYLVKTKALETGRENYITNVRRGFLEAVKDDGLKKGIRELFDNQKADKQAFQILDEKTDQILPLEKFFQFSLRRSGGIKPTKNVAKAATTYFKTLETKKALDALVPKIDIYTKSLENSNLTKTGLEMDDSLKRFVNQWLNTKRGRKTKLIAEQGGKVDIALNTIKAFTSIKDLAFSLPVGLASVVGEQATTFVNIGNKNYLKALKRLATKNGRKIVEDNKAFVGKSIWEELGEPSKNLGDKFTESMFGLFNQASREGNKVHLLGSLTDEEFKAGKVSAKRLAQMKLEAGRFRNIEKGKSVIGSTTEGGLLTQYKTWAIPILRTITDDIQKVAKGLAKGDIKGTVQSKELKELVRAAEISAGVLFLGNKFLDEEDDSFLGTLTKKLHREALTILGALDSKMMLSAPRVVSFAANLGQAMSNLVKLEEYKTKEGLVGVEQLKRELIPSAVKQFIPKEEATKKTSKRGNTVGDLFGGGATSQSATINQLFK